MRTGTGCSLQVSLQNGCAALRGNFFQAHLLAMIVA
jgi:hypothetical protein